MTVRGRRGEQLPASMRLTDKEKLELYAILRETLEP